MRFLCASAPFWNVSLSVLDTGADICWSLSSVLEYVEMTTPLKNAFHGKWVWSFHDPSLAPERSVPSASCCEIVTPLNSLEWAELAWRVPSLWYFVDETGVLFSKPNLFYSPFPSCSPRARGETAFVGFAVMSHSWLSVCSCLLLVHWLETQSCGLGLFVRNGGLNTWQLAWSILFQLWIDTRLTVPGSVHLCNNLGQTTSFILACFG